MGHNRFTSGRAGFLCRQRGCRDPALNHQAKGPQVLLVLQVAPQGAMGAGTQGLTPRLSWFISTTVLVSASLPVDDVLFKVDWLFNLAKTLSPSRLGLLTLSSKRLDLGHLPTSVAWSKVPEEGVLGSLLDRQKQTAPHFPAVPTGKSEEVLFCFHSVNVVIPKKA